MPHAAGHQVEPPLAWHDRVVESPRHGGAGLAMGRFPLAAGPGREVAEPEALADERTPLGNWSESLGNGAEGLRNGPGGLPNGSEGMPDGVAGFVAPPAGDANGISDYIDRSASSSSGIPDPGTGRGGAPSVGEAVPAERQAVSADFLALRPLPKPSDPFGKVQEPLGKPLAPSSKLFPPRTPPCPGGDAVDEADAGTRELRGGESEAGEFSGSDNPSAIASATPRDIREFAPSAAIAAGQRLTCGLKLSGEVLCFGNSPRYQVPRRIAVPSAAQLSIGRERSCARTTDGHVLCWQNNPDYDHGWWTAPADPGLVAGLMNVAEVRVGDPHACVRQDDGAVRCWGAGLSGELGDGRTRTALRPELLVWSR